MKGAKNQLDRSRIEKWGKRKNGQQGTRHGKMVKKRVKLKTFNKKQEPYLIFIIVYLFLESEIFSSSNKENKQLSLQKQQYSQNDALLVFQIIHGFASSMSIFRDII